MLPVGDQNGQVADRTSADAKLADLYRQYRRPVLGLAQRLLGDPSQAEDVLQETFFRVWQGFASFDPELGTFDTWIFTIARHVAIDHLRKKFRITTIRMYSLTTLSHTPADPCFAEWIRKKLLVLSDAQRCVITLAYFEGMSHREISLRLNKPIGTVKSQIRSALLVLKGEMALGR